MARAIIAISAAVALASVGGCKNNNLGDAVESAGETVGETVADGASTVADGAVSLVNVDLSNVLNDLALDLNIDRSNIPINAQIPITVAANVCGVSINILSVATGGSPNCTANSISPELRQYIQQQLAANGSVGGGAQTTTDGATTTDDGTTDDGTTTTDADGDPTTPQ